MFDQLLYGVDGHIRVLASTPALLSRGHPAANLVKEVCAGEIPHRDYDSDRGQAAFGWCTVGGLRVVYLRAVEREEGSRRYASVHVLVGPALELPVTELAVRYCSPGWWRGGSFDHLLSVDAHHDHLGPVLLRPASLDDLPSVPQVQVSPGDRLAIARTALTTLTGKKSTVDMEPAVIAGLLAELARDAPALLELMDVSTCDPAPIDPRDPRRRPHLAGLGAAAPTGSISPADSRPNIDRIARLIASDNPADRRLTANASRLVLRHPAGAVDPATLTLSGQSAPSTAAIVEHFIAFSCMTDDLRRTSQVTAQAVVAFLHDGHTASEILKMTDSAGSRVVSQEIAAALLVRDHKVSAAVAAVSPTLDPAVAQLLGRDLGERALEGLALRGLADALIHTRTMPTVRLGVLMAALAAPERAWAQLDLLDGVVRAECCLLSLTKLGPKDGLTDQVHRMLIAARDNRYLAGRSKLPLLWRATTLAEMVRTAHATNLTWVAGQLQTHASLVDPFAEVIAKWPDNIPALLEAMQPEAVLRLAPDLVQHCAPADRSRVLCASCDLVPPASLKAFVAVNADSTVFDGWRERVESLIEQVARTAARRVAAGVGWWPTAEDIKLVKRLDGLAAQLWRPIFDHYAGTEHVDLLGESISNSFKLDGLSLSPKARADLSTLALAGIVLSRSDWTRRHDTVKKLVGIQRSLLASELMKTALRAKRIPRQGVPAAADPTRFALAVVAQYVEDGSLKLTDTGQLADPDLHNLAKSLRAESNKDQPKHEWLNQEVARCGDLAQRWWQDLNPEPIHKRAVTMVRELIHRKKLTDGPYPTDAGPNNSGT